MVRCFKTHFLLVVAALGLALTACDNGSEGMSGSERQEFDQSRQSQQRMEGEIQELKNQLEELKSATGAEARESVAELENRIQDLEQRIRQVGQQFDESNPQAGTQDQQQLEDELSQLGEDVKDVAETATERAEENLEQIGEGIEETAETVEQGVERATEGLEEGDQGLPGTVVSRWFERQQDRIDDFINEETESDEVLMTSWQQQLPIFQGEVAETTDEYLKFLATPSNTEDMREEAEEVAYDLLDYQGVELANRVFQIQEVNRQMQEQGIQVPEFEERVSYLDAVLNNSIDQQNERAATQQRLGYGVLTLGFAVLVGYAVSPTSSRLIATRVMDDVSRLNPRNRNKMTGAELAHLRKWKAGLDEVARTGRWRRITALEEAGSPVPKVSDEYANNLLSRAVGDKDLLADYIKAMNSATHKVNLDEAVQAANSLRTNQSREFFAGLLSQASNFTLDHGTVRMTNLKSPDDVVRFVKEAVDDADKSLVDDFADIHFRPTKIENVETFVAGGAHADRILLKVGDDVMVGIHAGDQMPAGQMDAIAKGLLRSSDEVVTIKTADGILTTDLRLSQLSNQTLRSLQTAAGGALGFGEASALDSLNLLPRETVHRPGSIVISEPAEEMQLSENQQN